MGVVNVTPDSFYDGGRYADTAAAVSRALELEGAGADIIDIGGESSRPGSEPVPAREERARVIPVIEELSGRLGIPISIDTWKSEVAAAALEKGARIINDISALRFDPAMLSLAARSSAACILMHMRGDPVTMQDRPIYDDLLEELKEFFRERIAAAVPGFLHAHWCGADACEAAVQEETKATIRCVPLGRPAEKGRCVQCGAPSEGRVAFAKAY